MFFDDELENRSCSICGDDFKARYPWHTVCDVCVEEYKNDIDVAVLAGNRPESVKLGAIFAWFFTQREMEAILLRELMRLHKKNPIDFTGLYNENRSNLAKAINTLMEKEIVSCKKRTGNA